MSNVAMGHPAVELPVITIKIKKLESGFCGLFYRNRICFRF